MKVIIIKNFRIAIVPILLMGPLLFVAFDFWWQIINYNSYSANHTLTLISIPTTTIWVGALIITTLIILVGSTIFKYKVGYYTVKFILLIYNILMLFTSLYYLPRLWDYGAATYVNGNLISRKLTFDESLYDIYLPIGLSVLLTYMLFRVFKFWISDFTKKHFN